MVRRKQHWDIVVVGDVGYDAYLLPGNHSAVRPAGSAYNIACGLVASRASATLIANVPARFDRTALDVLKRANIDIVEQPLDPLFDQLYVFDYRMGVADQPSFCSTAQQISPDFDTLSNISLKGYIVHVGTMQPRKVLAAMESIGRTDRARIVSANLYLDYLQQDPLASVELLKRCNIVFLNQREFEIAAQAVGMRTLCEGRILIVSLGEKGATLLVDGIPSFHYFPRSVDAICPVGAGDVLVGAFLGVFSQTRDPSVALAFACEAASRSTTDYGVLRCFDLLAASRDFAQMQDLIGSKTLGVATLVDEKLITSGIASNETYIEATALFVVRNENLLIVKKPADKGFVPGLLYVPGGKLAPGESAAECARRELMEETGLEAVAIKPVAVFSYRDASCRRVYKFYQFLITPGSGEGHPSSDISNIEWIPFADLDPAKLFNLTWAQVVLMQFGDFLRGLPVGAP